MNQLCMHFFLNRLRLLVQKVNVKKQLAQTFW